MAGLTSAGSQAGTEGSVDMPVWARADALRARPDQAEGGSAYGFFDHKSVKHEASSMDELVEIAKSSRDGIDLVWSPESEYCQVPEEIPALHHVLKARRKKLAERDISDGIRMSSIFGLVLLWTLYAAWNNGGRSMEALYSHQLSGLSALLLLIFGLLPLYEGFKARFKLSRGYRFQDEVPEARFDAWLDTRKIPVTWGLLGLLGLVCVNQLWTDGWGAQGLPLSIQRAGQLKVQAAQYSHLADAQSWWRVLTAGMLHGNIVHFLVNASGILYLGRRTEALARWPHLLIVFFVTMWVGGLMSAWFLPEKPAVGASGGLMGLLGFMLVFESLHKKLVPRPARRRLLAGVFLMGLMGFLGMSFIDNAAHAGGLVAGMVYALIVFPKSSSAVRPRLLIKDQLVGFAIGITLICLGFFACFQILVP